mgnify:CR=1 FL=1
MSGTVKLLTGRVPQVKRDAKYYSVSERHKIINLWKENFEDAVIQIAPDPDLEGEKKWCGAVGFACTGIKHDSWLEKYGV